MCVLTRALAISLGTQAVWQTVTNGQKPLERQHSLQMLMRPPGPEENPRGALLKLEKKIFLSKWTGTSGWKLRTSSNTDVWGHRCSRQTGSRHFSNPDVLLLFPSPRHGGVLPTKWRGVQFYAPVKLRPPTCGKIIESFVLHPPPTLLDGVPWELCGWLGGTSHCIHINDIQHLQSVGELGTTGAVCVPIPSSTANTWLDGSGRNRWHAYNVICTHADSKAVQRTLRVTTPWLVHLNTSHNDGWSTRSCTTQPLENWTLRQRHEHDWPMLMSVSAWDIALRIHGTHLRTNWRETWIAARTSWTSGANVWCQSLAWVVQLPAGPVPNAPRGCLAQFGWVRTQHAPPRRAPTLPRRRRLGPGLSSSEVSSLSALLRPLETCTTRDSLWSESAMVRSNASEIPVGWTPTNVTTGESSESNCVGPYKTTRESVPYTVPDVGIGLCQPRTRIGNIFDWTHARPNITQRPMLAGTVDIESTKTGTNGSSSSSEEQMVGSTQLGDRWGLMGPLLWNFGGPGLDAPLWLLGNHTENSSLTRISIRCETIAPVTHFLQFALL